MGKKGILWLLLTLECYCQFLIQHVKIILNLHERGMAICFVLKECRYEVDEIRIRYENIKNEWDDKYLKKINSITLPEMDEIYLSSDEEGPYTYWGKYW